VKLDHLALSNAGVNSGAIPPIYLSIYLSIYSSTVLLLDLGRFSSILILYTVGRTPWTGDQPVAKPLPTHRTIKTQNKFTQISMPRVGFEPMIPAFERAKTVHALDRAVTVIGPIPSPISQMQLLSAQNIFKNTSTCFSLKMKCRNRGQWAPLLAWPLTKMCVRVQTELNAFLTSALDGGER
jgi:hypothetical protein